MMYEDESPEFFVRRVLDCCRNSNLSYLLVTLRLFACACARHVLPCFDEKTRLLFERSISLIEKGMASHVFLRPHNFSSDYIDRYLFAAAQSLSLTAFSGCGIPWKRGLCDSAASVNIPVRQFHQRIVRSGISFEQQRDMLADVIPYYLSSLQLSAFPEPVSWLSPTVVELATQITLERSYVLLPLLADALEDAGCDEADLLDHCRHAPQHVFGCWSLDYVLRVGSKYFSRNPAWSINNVFQ